MTDSGPNRLSIPVFAYKGAKMAGLARVYHDGEVEINLRTDAGKQFGLDILAAARMDLIKALTVGVIPIPALEAGKEEIDSRTIYLVYKNSDMIEGRGPMVLDRIYQHEEEAWAYADQQPGVMGRKHNGSWRDKRMWPYGGDWEVRPIPIY
jgi:hypothetical protein